MARYHEIADDLRARIKAGEWKVGDKLPGISALQDHYEVEKSLGTIRSAQQLLVADGMLRTEQGVGAFVTATEPIRPVLDLAATLIEAQNLIGSALAAVRNPKGTITLDLMDEDSYFVLRTALRDFADRVTDDAENNPDGAEDRLRWVQTADRLLTRMDAARS